MEFVVEPGDDPNKRQQALKMEAGVLREFAASEARRRDIFCRDDLTKPWEKEECDLG